MFEFLKCTILTIFVIKYRQQNKIPDSPISVNSASTRSSGDSYSSSSSTRQLLGSIPTTETTNQQTKNNEQIDSTIHV